MLFILLYLCKSLIISEPGLIDFTLEANGTVSIDLSSQFFNLLIFASSSGTNVSLIQNDNISLDFYIDPAIFVSTQFISIKNNNLSPIYVMIWTGPFNICPNKGILLYSTKSVYFKGLLDQGMTDFCLFNIGYEKITSELLFKDKKDSKAIFYRVSDIVGQTKPYNCLGCDFESSIPYFISVSYTNTAKNEIEVSTSGKQREIPKECLIFQIPILKGNKATQNDSLKVKITKEKCGFISLSQNETLIISIIFYVCVGMIILIVIIVFIVKCIRKPKKFKTKEEKELFFTKKEKNEAPETPLQGFDINISLSNQENESNQNPKTDIADNKIDETNIEKI